MANIAKYCLEANDRKFLAEILERFPGKQGVLADLYKLDRRRFGRRALGTSMGRINFDRMRRLISDLRFNLEGMLNKAGIVESAFDTDTNSILLTAQKLSQQQFFHAAFDTLMHGFCHIEQRRSLEAASSMLSQIIYTGYRHCRSEHFCQQLRINILPRITQRARGPRGGLGDDLLHWTCASQLACALNEGGSAGASILLFDAQWVGKLLGHRDVPQWLGPQLLRNYAHHCVWYGNDRRSLERGLSLVNEASERNKSLLNHHSVAHSQSDLYLSRRKYQEAWEAIAGRYWAVRDALISRRPWPESFGISLLLAYAIFLSGVIARAVLRADGYDDDALRDDIAGLKYWLDQFGGHVESGHSLELPIEESMPADLQDIVRRSRKQVLLPEQINVLTELARVLV